MVWEVVAIWVIVTATIVWFIRDERAVRLEKLDQQARLYATGAAWRHRAPPIRRIPAQLSTRDLTDVQRRFLEEVRRQREAGIRA